MAFIFAFLITLIRFHENRKKTVYLQLLDSFYIISDDSKALFKEYETSRFVCNFISANSRHVVTHGCNLELFRGKTR